MANFFKDSTLDFDKFYLDIYNVEFEIIENKHIDFKNLHPEFEEETVNGDFFTQIYKEYSSDYKYDEYDSPNSFRSFENKFIKKLIEHFKYLHKQFKKNLIANYFNYKTEFEDHLKNSLDEFSKYPEETKSKIPNSELIIHPKIENLLAIIAKNRAMEDFRDKFIEMENKIKQNKDLEGKGKVPAVQESTLITYYVFKELGYDFEVYGNKIKVNKFLSYLTGLSENSIEKILTNPLIDKDKIEISSDRIEKMVNKLREMKFEKAADLLKEENKR